MRIINKMQHPRPINGKEMKNIHFTSIFSMGIHFSRSGARFSFHRLNVYSTKNFFISLPEFNVLYRRYQNSSRCHRKSERDCNFYQAQRGYNFLHYTAFNNGQQLIIATQVPFEYNSVLSCLEGLFTTFKTSLCQKTFLDDACILYFTQIFFHVVSHWAFK